ncbi:MAG: hypothetical protein JJE21_04905 [Spirochaetaceae bacterium]|nr:hypothetical protein [Spirochaetaceae bacterium]
MLPKVIIITDTQYYVNMIENQKTKLKFEAFKNGRFLEIKEVSLINDSLIPIIDNKTSTLILSPLVSYNYKNVKEKVDNPYVSIGVMVQDNNSKVAIIDKSYNGWIDLAHKLKESNNPIYLISDSSWPFSDERATAFINEFGTNGLTHIELDGSELKQYSLTLIDKIKKEGIHEVVFTGSSLISYFMDEDDTLNYCVPSSLYSSVNYAQLDKVVYDDLTPIFDSLNTDKNTIIISQGVWDFQEGLKNSLKQLLKSIQSNIY